MSRKLIVCLIMALLVSVSYADYVIGNWESGSLDGWDGNGNGTLATGATVGVTLGSNSLEVTDSGSGGWIQTLRWSAGVDAEKAAFMQNDTLEFDVSVAANDGTITAGYSKIIKVNMNNGSAGWGNAVSGDLQDATTFYWWEGSPERTVHVSFDYSAYRDLIYDVNPDGSGGGYIQIIFETQTGGGAPPQMYYDNVVLTPEPMTIALLGLGGLMLRRRK